jgi:hypothetical protein
MNEMGQMCKNEPIKAPRSWKGGFVLTESFRVIFRKVLPIANGVLAILLHKIKLRLCIQNSLTDSKKT